MIWNLLLESSAGSETAGEGATGGSNIGSIIMLIVIVVAIVGMFIWQSVSNKKKQKEAKNMVDSLRIGDRVKTIGGICGYVAQINDGENTFVLETGLEGNKSYVKFDKGAIYQTARGDGAKTAPVAEEKVEEVKVEEQTAPVEEKVEAEKPAPVKAARKSGKKKEEI